MLKYFLMSTNIEQFQDMIWDLEQRKQDRGISSRADVIEHEDTAEVLSSMEALVIECPDVTEFYAGALKKYKHGKPESVANESKIIRERIELMHAEDDMSDRKYMAAREKIATGEIVQEEAELFFKMFKHVLPKEAIPTVKRQSGSKTTASAEKIPRQARTIDVEITQHGGIRANGLFLRALTEAQKLIILSGLAKGEGFRNSEIYRSAEFRAAVGTQKSDAELKQTFKEEFDGLQEYLVANRLRRLIDANRKPNERKHTVSAHTVTDLRTAQQRQTRADFSTVPPLPAAASRYFEDDQAVLVRESSPVTPDAEQVFGESLIKEAHQAALTVISEHDGITRVGMVELFMNKFAIEEPKARKLVSAMYEYERCSGDQQVFTQVKGDGPKRFERIPEGQLQRRHSKYGSYFEDDSDAFQARFGEVKGVTVDYVNYERGAIRFNGVEAAIMRYFADPTTPPSALSEKQVIFELSQQGVDTTKEQLRSAVKVINALAGKEFMRCLPPASRSTAAKGPRVQCIGSFAES